MFALVTGVHTCSLPICFEDIAAALGRDAAACRQLASRARANVRTERPRFTIDRKHGMELAAAFFQASHGEGITNLSALLASGVRFHSDAGGRRPTVARIWNAATQAVPPHAALTRLGTGQPGRVRSHCVTALPGFLPPYTARALQTTPL